VRLSKIGLKLYGPPVTGFGFGRSSLLIQRKPERMMSGRQARIELDCLPQAIDSQIQATGLAGDQTEQVPGVCVAGINFGRLPAKQFRLVPTT